MVSILDLSKADFRSSFREPIFKILFCFPFAAFAMVRWLLPLLEVRYPAIIPYKEVILMWACIQSATMFGFIYGFLLLEEKEEDIWSVIRITPVPLSTIIFSRLLIGFSISSIINFCLISYGKVIYVEGYKEILLSLVFSLEAPLIAMSLGAFAKNRIEGLAFMKIINLVLIVPALIYFIDLKIAHITSFIPTYWTYRSMEHADSTTYFFYFIGISLVIHFIFFFLLNKKISGKTKASS